jgi:hypothetical protein
MTRARASCLCRCHLTNGCDKMVACRSRLVAGSMRRNAPRTHAQSDFCRSPRSSVLNRFIDGHHDTVRCQLSAPNTVPNPAPSPILPECGGRRGSRFAAAGVECIQSTEMRHYQCFFPGKSPLVRQSVGMRYVMPQAHDGVLSAASRSVSPLNWLTTELFAGFGQRGDANRLFPCRCLFSDAHRGADRRVPVRLPGGLLNVGMYVDRAKAIVNGSVSRKEAGRNPNQEICSVIATRTRRGTRTAPFQQGQLIATMDANIALGCPSHVQPPQLATCNGGTRAQSLTLADDSCFGFCRRPPTPTRGVRPIVFSADGRCCCCCCCCSD